MPLGTTICWISLPKLNQHLLYNSMLSNKNSDSSKEFSPFLDPRNSWQLVILPVSHFLSVMDFLGIEMDLDNIFRLAKELGFSKEETLWLVMEEKERVRKGARAKGTRNETQRRTCGCARSACNEWTINFYLKQWLVSRGGRCMQEKKKY